MSVVLIDPRARALTISDAAPSPDWRGWSWPSYTLLDGVGELSSTSARKRRYAPFPPGFKLPDYVRPRDGSVWPRLFDGRAYVTPLDGVTAEYVLDYLTKEIQWLSFTK